jgi:hypothetical protein
MSGRCDQPVSLDGRCAIDVTADDRGTRLSKSLRRHSAHTPSRPRDQCDLARQIHI